MFLFNALPNYFKQTFNDISIRTGEGLVFLLLVKWIAVSGDKNVEIFMHEVLPVGSYYMRSCSSGHLKRSC